MENLNEIAARAQAAKERADKASGVNWKVEEFMGDTRVVGKITDDNGKTRNVVIAVMDGYPFMQEHTAEAIAAAREDVPALADDVLALVDEVKGLTLAIERIKANTQGDHCYFGNAVCTCAPASAACNIAYFMTLLGEKIRQEAGSEGQG